MDKFRTRIAHLLECGHWQQDEPNRLIYGDPKRRRCDTCYGEARRPGATMPKSKPEPKQDGCCVCGAQTDDPIECHRCHKLACMACVTSLGGGDKCHPFIDLRWTCDDCLTPQERADL